MTVEITQFHRPNGRQTLEKNDGINDKCQPGYNQIRECGCRLTGEVLTTGQVSLTIEHPEGDVAIRIVPNGPEVISAIEEMLMEFKPEHVAEMLENA